ERRCEHVATREVFAARERHRNLITQGAPLAPWPIRAQRLFEPHQAKLAELRRFVDGLTKRPTLIDVDRELQVADQAAEIPQVLAVAFLAEADLQLEGAMTTPHRGFRHGNAAVRIDATGIGAHAPGRTAEHLP